MAKDLKCSTMKCILMLLAYCIASSAADPHSSKLSQKWSQHHSASYKPEPHDFPNKHLQRAYLAIQRFKKTVTCDPKNITASWTGNDICGRTSYSGFYCNSPTKQADITVTAVIFNGFGLCAPELQGFVDQLPDVALFQASSNDFGGEIPRLGGLSYLYQLNVRKAHQANFSYDDSKFALIRAMANVGGIMIKINLISVPSGSQNGTRTPGATSAQALLFNDNSLSGPLPVDIGFSKLSYLAVANNKLTGPIPASIGYLKDSLLEVLLLNNQLSGCIPYEIGMLHKAAVIDAGMNQLTGPIPSSFSCLNSVEQLNLAGNRLYGDVPDALCKLAGPAGRLANVTLSSNYFTSVGPACAALIKEGVLDVKNNCIPAAADPAGGARGAGAPPTGWHPLRAPLNPP